MNSKPAPSLTFEIDEIDSDYRPDKAFETYLFSEERLRSSPELWPEQIPGMCDLLRSSSPLNSDIFQCDSFGEKQEPPEWVRDLDQDDINMLNGLSSLNTNALFEKVKELKDLSFQLGVEEAHEMTRGKFLSILTDADSFQAFRDKPRAANHGVP